MPPALERTGDAHLGRFRGSPRYSGPCRSVTHGGPVESPRHGPRADVRLAILARETAALSRRCASSRSSLLRGPAALLDRHSRAARRGSGNYRGAVRAPDRLDHRTFAFGLQCAETNAAAAFPEIGQTPVFREPRPIHVADGNCRCAARRRDRCRSRGRLFPPAARTPSTGTCCEAAYHCGNRACADSALRRVGGNIERRTRKIAARGGAGPSEAGCAENPRRSGHKEICPAGSRVL